MNSESVRQAIRNGFGTVVLFFLLAGSLVLNVIQGWQLRARPRFSAASSNAAVMAGIRPGSLLPPISGLTPHGEKADLTFESDKPTIIYVLSPSCGWCRRNRNNITALYATEKSRFHFVGLSVSKDKLAEHLTSTPLPFPVFSIERTDARLQKLGFFDATPQTVVVGSDGVVQKAWMGAYMPGSQLEELQRFFRTTLPGLSAENHPGSQRAGKYGLRAHRSWRARVSKEATRTVGGGGLGVKLKRQIPDPPASEGLTPREMEVAALIARAETNQEIAKALGVSVRTAKFHVSNILAKRQLFSRVQIAVLRLDTVTPSAKPIARASGPRGFGSVRVEQETAEFVSPKIPKRSITV